MVCGSNAVHRSDKFRISLLAPNCVCSPKTQWHCPDPLLSLLLFLRPSFIRNTSSLMPLYKHAKMGALVVVVAAADKVMRGSSWSFLISIPSTFHRFPHLAVSQNHIWPLFNRPLTYNSLGKLPLAIKLARIDEVFNGFSVHSI